MSVRVGYFATATVVGRVPAGVFLPRPKVESVLVEIERRQLPAVDPALASFEEIDLLLRAGFGGRRKMLRRSLEGLVDEEVFAAAGIDGRCRAEELGHREVGQAGRMPPVDHLLAPAKLTRQLRVVGVRGDGYHLLEAEMATLDLADELEIDEGGEGLEIDDEVAWVSAAQALAPRRPSRPARRRRVLTTSSSRALVLAGRNAAVRLRKRIPAGAGLGGGSADAAAVLRWAGVRDRETACRLGADVPFCLVGGRALVCGIGEQVEPLGFEAFTWCS